ncbi:site-specific integrase [Anoxybacillus sp. UARK-01]|uniref:tyrosine-type recombinase/integrase n=1 Tax=Anoxybacillus sp. UARK-01 TaxID=1895648 RepID=UPI0009BB1D85|nr:site-specific integrase [Anoxybacillus sp. UARK-01]OQM47499.1 site-specific integrase [Anoxybacillus sp. UARK-01]
MAYFQEVKAKNKKGYKWRCVLEAPPHPVTGKRRQISRTADTKKEALARAEAALEKLIDDGIDEREIKNLPFEKMAWEWLNVYAKSGVKKGSVRVREKEIKIILQHYAKVNIDKVTPRLHQKMLNDMHEKGYTKKGENGEIIYKPYATTTIEGVNTTANMIFKYAIKHKMIKDNPCEGVVIPKKTLTVEEIEGNAIEEMYFERNELEEFLSAAIKYGLPLDKEWFYLLAFSGMRVGEMLVLKWSDIDFKRNEIRITKTLYNPDNNMKKYELTPPKTKGSIRTIGMDAEIMEMLKAYKAKQNEIVMANRMLPDGKGGTIPNPDYHDGDFVFCRHNGYPFIQKNVNIRMQRILKKTSIKKRATPHILRHTHISMCAEAEVDLPTIMKRVGHEDQETTLKIYTHVTEKMKKDANQKIKNVFGDILKNTK